MGQSLREFRNFTQNVKKTSLGVRFARQLFTDPYGMNPKMIVNALRALGMNVPREAVVTADMAQMIVSGQAAVSAINTGKDFNQIVTPSVATISAAFSIMSQLGWVKDEDGSISMSLELGSDVCLLVASCGLDVRAWVSLATMSYRQNVKNKAMADFIAKKSVIEQVNQYLSKEQINFGKNFESFTKGEIGVLGWIAKNCYNAPTTFLTNIKDNKSLREKMPFLNDLDFLPEWQITFSSQSSVRDTFLGLGAFNVQSSSHTEILRTLERFDNEDQVRAYVFKYLIEPHIAAYEYANNYFSGRSLSIENLSMLYGMGAPLSVVFPNTNAFESIEALRLTPTDLGESFIQTFIDVSGKSTQDIFKSAGISISGQQSFVKKQPSYFEQNKKQILLADTIGDSNFLYSFDEVRERMRSMCSFPMISDQYRMAFDRGGEFRQIAEKNMGWRKIANFCVGLGYLDMVRKDPYFFKWENENLKKYSFMKSSEEYQKKFELIYKTSLIRRINENAKGVVSYFLGTTPDRLKRKNGFEVDQPAIYTVKG